MIELIILFFLILLNAFIVMCEMALVSAKKNRLETSAAKGDIKSKTVLELKENPDIFLSTTQIYITLISILTGVYSGAKFSAYLQPYLEHFNLSLIHISEPTRRTPISYAVFCLKKKKK